MDTVGVIQLVIVFILVLLSAFFSSAETALTTANKVRLRSMEEAGNKSAAIVNKILSNYNKMLSTILIGNNIVNISASSLATVIASNYFGSYAVGIATGLLTITVLLFGEIVPKTWAMFNADKISLVYSRIIYGLMVILTPVIFLINILSNAIMKLLHIDPNKKTALMTENELKTYVDVSHEDGVIESEEREMIYNVFDFSDVLAKDIMIPRIHMETVNINAGYDELFDIFRECMYTRIPVYKEDKDNIIGLVNIKDFILVTDKENFSIETIMRNAHYTYEYKKSADLMLEMRQKATNVAFVLNEYGSTIGMITLEDLLEEIVGEIRDEYDEDEEELIQEVDERTYLIEASMKLDDINDALDTNLDSDDYDSIGGIIIELLDRLPEDGEQVTLANGITLQVKGIDQNRIAKVLMTLPAPECDTDENTENGTEHKSE